MKVTSPPAEMKLPEFYKKYVSAQGYPIISSEKVSDYALLEAAHIVNMMLARRPDVRKAMIESGSRMVVMAYNEFTTDVPEYSHMKPKDYWDARARGLGGSQTDPLCSCAEENVLAYPGDPYSTENIVIHEFAHNIHLRGLVNVDPKFDDRLKAAYEAARAAGLWSGKYASTNHHEYFAEGVQSWFDNNREPDHDHNHVNTRRELREYDPRLAKICEEVFGETELVYTKPTTRLVDHLTGYDPAAAPTFQWPERLKAAQRKIRASAEERNRKANEEQKKPLETPGKPDLKPEFDAALKHEQRQIEGWQVQVDKALLSEDHKELGENALRILAAKLHQVAAVMPADRLARLREVPIYLDHRHKLGNMQYHPSAGWLRRNGYDAAMEKCVHIPRAEQLVNMYKRTEQPWAVLHELAHAYHDRFLTFEEAEIMAAYERAKNQNLYEEVLHAGGRTQKHYALTNHKEFFAEMSESFFGTNDFFPFVRAELRRHDPQTNALLEKIWIQPLEK